MKKINTILAIVFSLVVLLAGARASAATSNLWNGASNDCWGLSIANVSTNTGGGNPCWTATSVSAVANDDINVRLYYHNSSDLFGDGQTATNVRLSLSANTASSTSHSFNATLSSDQGSISLGQVNLSISTAQTIAFYDARWYPNQSQSPSGFPSGSGSSIMSGGVSIGSVAPGWNSQGSVVVSFLVGSTAAPQLCKDPTASNFNQPLPCSYPPAPTACVINNFTANPTSITFGQASNLSWSTTGCTSASISSFGSVTPSFGNQSVSPVATTTYTLLVYGQSGTPTSRTATVSVGAAPQRCTDSTATNYGSVGACTYPTAVCRIVNFNALPTVITAGQLSILNWNTTGCNSANITSIGNVATSGTQTVSPASTTSYTLTAYGISGAQVAQSVTVSVTATPLPPALCTDTTATNFNQPLPCNYPTAVCRIVNFNASSTYLTTGQNSILSWSTTNCNSVNISNLGSVNTNGSLTVYPSYTTTYVLTASGSTGSPASQSVTVTVNSINNNYCNISYFTASPSYITSGQSSNISWSTNNCNTVSISNLNSYYGSNNLSAYGSQTVYPTYTTTYTLTAFGNNGAVQTQSVTVSVNSNINNNYNNYSNCYISSFYASPTYINSGQASTLTWNTYGCNSVSISNLNNYRNTTSYLGISGSQTVYPTYTTTYVLTAYGDNGSFPSQSVTVSVNGGYINNPLVNIYNACAVTTVATNVTSTSATLNGLITNPNGGVVNSYFEYGPTVNLGSVTPSVTTNGAYSQVIGGLSEDTIYFFRSVANCSNGLSYGKMEILNTEKAAGTGGGATTVIRQGTTVVGTSSPIILKIENRYQAIGVGDIIDYTVTYKNIGTSTLTHPVLQVVVPKGIVLTNSSNGTYSRDTNTLTIPLNDLFPGAEGAVYIQGHVESITEGNAQIVTTAILVYTNPSGAQENAIAYVLNVPRTSNNNLGASAFFSGFGGFGLIWWLLIIIIILLIILIARQYRNSTTVHRVDPSGLHTTTTTTNH
jgi:Domain of unknown function DUF11